MKLELVIIEINNHLSTTFLLTAKQMRLFLKVPYILCSQWRWFQLGSSF